MLGLGRMVICEGVMPSVVIHQTDEIFAKKTPAFHKQLKLALTQQLLKVAAI